MRKIHLFMDGNQIAATWDNFDCLATSPAGFGDTIGESIADLIKNTQAHELNCIVSSIENAPQNALELAATVPAVAAANNESDAIALIFSLHQAVSTGLAPGIWYHSNRALVEKIAQQARVS